MRGLSLIRLPVIRPKPPPPVLGGSPDDVEAQFYDALRRGDVEALMALWADDEDIVCVHPGGQRLIGVAAIRAGFESILANGGLPVRPEQVRRLWQVGSALHHVVERIEVSTESGTQTAWVVASNFYIRTAQGWRLASHHASPGGELALSAPSGEPPATLH